MIKLALVFLPVFFLLHENYLNESKNAVLFKEKLNTFNKFVMVKTKYSADDVHPMIMKKVNAESSLVYRTFLQYQGVMAVLSVLFGYSFLILNSIAAFVMSVFIHSDPLKSRIVLPYGINSELLLLLGVAISMLVGAMSGSCGKTSSSTVEEEIKVESRDTKVNSGKKKKHLN